MSTLCSYPTPILIVHKNVDENVTEETRNTYFFNTVLPLEVGIVRNH